MPIPIGRRRRAATSGSSSTIPFSHRPNIKSYALSFPTPHRFDDGNTHWAGYKKPISLPVTLTVADPAKPAHLKGHAFLGICETICIPVKAEFDFAVDNTKPTDPLTKTLIDSAFEQLPGQATTTFGARSAIRKDDHVRVTVDLPSDDPNTDIFVAGDGIVGFGMSKLKDRKANNAVFSVRIISGKDKKTPPLNYTLVQGDKAVSGTISVQE